MRLPRSASAGMLLLSCCLIPTLAAASTDPTTGLPTFPGATVVESQPPTVSCGITIRGVQYQSDETATKGVDFFRKALPGASTWTVPARMIITEFLMPNGKAMVRVLGTPDGMYIIYGSLSKPVTMSQLRAGLKC
jgi:hypothetical protein